MRKTPASTLFLTAAQSIKLMPSERKDLLSNIVLHCVNGTSPSAILRPEEKHSLRAGLEHISSLRPRELLKPEVRAPLSLWVGSNLFGHLRPFIV